MRPTWGAAQRAFTALRLERLPDAAMREFRTAIVLNPENAEAQRSLLAIRSRKLLEKVGSALPKLRDPK